MKIEYFGHSCFRLTTDSGVSVLTDPYTGVGYELPQGLQADIITVSHGHFDHNYTQGVDGAPKVIDTAGQYAIQGVEIIGEESFHDPKKGALRGKNILFKITVDDITFCHFGDLGEEYGAEIAQKLNGEVWLIPIGGTYTIDAEQAKEYIEKLSPKLVIPMHYRPADGSLDIAPADGFLKRIPWEITECKNGEYSLQNTDLTKEETQILYMERK